MASIISIIKKIFEKKIVLVILLIISFLLASVVLLSQPRINMNSIDLSRPQKLYRDVELIYPDNSSSMVTLPKKINTTKTMMFVFDLSKINDLEDKSIKITHGFTELRCLMDDREFYAFHTGKAGYTKSSGGNASYIIDLPKKIKSPYLYVRYTPTLDNPYPYTINPIYIGYRTNFLTEMFTLKNVLAISLASLLILLFIHIVIFSLLNKRFDHKHKYKFLYVSLISFIVSIYSLSKNDITIYFLSEYKELLYFLEYGSFMLITFPLVKLSEFEVEKNSSNICLFIIFVNFITQTYLNFSKTYEYVQMMPINYFVHSLAIIVVVITAIARRDRWTTDNKNPYMLSGVFIIVLYVLSLILYITNRDLFFTVLILIITASFLAMQFYFISYTFIKTNEENISTMLYKTILETDELTKLSNRYMFENKMKELNKTKQSVTIISVDLNNLKIINDEFGHLVGDKAILYTANFLKTYLPDSQIFRVGGDEFVIISKQPPMDFLSGVRNSSVVVDGLSDKIDVSISVGSCVYDKALFKTVEDALKIADKNMYFEKNLYKHKKSI